MPSRELRRPVSDEERAELERILASASTPLQRAKSWLSNTVILTAAASLAVIVVWLIVAAILRATAGLHFGWNSVYRLPVVAWSIGFCTVFSALYNYRWIKSQKNLTPAIQTDLAEATVSEEHYDFSDAKRFQEQEHGGLIYFLKSSDGNAYVLYDHESQDLSVQGAAPLSSSFMPKTHMLVVRAPHSRLVLRSEFSGSPLALSDPIDLLLPPSSWPEQEEYTTVRWEDLEAHYGCSGTARA